LAGVVFGLLAVLLVAPFLASVFAGAALGVFLAFVVGVTTFLAGFLALLGLLVAGFGVACALRVLL